MSTAASRSGERYDCIVIGGGPAGATAGALLAEYGHRTLILEKDRFPRHHIGESLMPATYWTFRRLGVLERLKTSNFPRKESVQFVSETGRDSAPYFFTDRDPGEWSVTWQVRRDEFDALMLDNAREKGAEVRSGVAVDRVLMDAGRAVGVLAADSGARREIHAQAIVDASGQSAILANQLDLRRGDAKLRNAAIYGYFRGAKRDEGRNAGATIILNLPQRAGWFWFIPLPDDLASIGVVAPPAYLTNNRGGDPSRTLAEEIEKCPGMRDRLADAEQIGPTRVCRDFSYLVDRMGGDGWVLAGDALGFLDPVYSSGVMLALKSGEFAADAIHEGLERGDLSERQLRKYEPQFRRAVALLKNLVYAFYDRSFSFGAFLKAHPEHRDNLVRLLIGDVFNDEVGKIFGPMSQWTRLPEPIESPRGGASR
ncbi:MAG: NAD(P)/FAD-dependent oxidoreductase [Planctomycetota bacterium]|nr:MAG: NAD(P)/FAD-dependent oxidoreductase [Planctomycetota bacterium]